jgi:hypothetical protein
VILVFAFATNCQAYSGGTGEPNSPFEISTVADWQELADSNAHWNKHFVITADIDFAGAAVPRIGGDYSDRAFAGVLDGDGHVISNIRVNMPDSPNVGLFGCLEGRIRNLGIENVSVIGDGHVGGIAGYIGDGSITGCYVTGNVTGQSYVGGLVGRVPGYEKVKVLNCYTHVNVSGETYVGGIVGYAGGNIARYCYAAGRVSGETRVGGVVGYAYDDIGCCSACFWDVNTSGVSPDVWGGDKSTEEMKDIETYLHSRWDFTVEDHDAADWVMPEGDYPRLAWEYWERGIVPDVNGMHFYEAAAAVKGAGFFVGMLSYEVSETVPVGCIVRQSPPPDSNGIRRVTKVDMAVSCRKRYSGGSGSAEDPYVIADFCDWLRFARNARYGGAYSDRYLTLTGDIDFRDAEVLSIGSLAGVFDGNDHVIRNAVLDAEYGLAALFQSVDERGLICNLRVEDVHTEVGGLVSINWGEIINCHVSGWVEADRLSAGHFAEVDLGGLVGRNEGVITASSSSGLTGGGSNIGGLVGYNGGRIIACYSDADTCSGALYAGGLVGHNRGQIVNSYARGSAVPGARAVYGGGLVGHSEYGSVANCYSTGSFQGRLGSGGLVGGGRNPGSTSGSFWDMDTSGADISEGGEGKSTVEMQDANTFVSAGWDFAGESANGTEDLWTICEGTNYPRLVWQVPVADWLCPDGVEGRDFSFLAQYWGRFDCNSANEHCGGADFDMSGRVDANDLFLFSEQWLEQNRQSNGPFAISEAPEPATEPNPAVGAVEVRPSTSLRWEAGQGAFSHDVYLSTDASAVADANTTSAEYMGRRSGTVFHTGHLDLAGQTLYYWRIDEVNHYGTTVGEVWFFTTSDEVVK